MKLVLSCSLFLLLSNCAYAAQEDTGKPMNKEKIQESYVMLYYRDMEAPRKFYRDLLGLETTFEDDWVSLYRINPGAYVGVVREGDTAYHRVQDSNAVMLSLVVSNVDSWYEKFKSAGAVKVLKEIYNHEEAPIRAFLVEDPGGYTIEVFQWLKK